MLVPGQSIPAEGSQSGSSTSSSSSASSEHGLSKGAIAGIAVAGAAFIAILVALFFVLGLNRAYKQHMPSKNGSVERTANWAFFNNSGETWSTNRKSEFDNNATTRSPNIGDCNPSPNLYPGTFPNSPDSISAYGALSLQRGSSQWNRDMSREAHHFGGPSGLSGPSELEANSIIF